MEIAKLFESQRSFFESGKTKDVQFRKDRLRILLGHVIAFEEELYDALQKDFGKAVFESISSEWGMVVSALKDQLKNLYKRSEPRWVWPALVNFPSVDRIYYEPYGRVLVISPWNYPFNLSMIPLIEAVAAGNTVMLKPSEFVPHTNRVIRKIIEKSFDPAHVCLVEGDANTARDLLEKRWDFIFFTGSTQVGRYVYQAAAKHLTPVTLELGGKSPAIIDDTAHLKLSAKRVAWGKFLNAGQTCIAPDYVIIRRERVNAWVEELVGCIEKFYGKNPADSPDYTRIINERNFNRLKRYLKNQNVVYGGDTDEETLYFSPTLVLNPSLESDLMEDEIFGPILPVLTYEKDEDLVEILKLHPNPLAMYVFSNNKRFITKLIKQFPSGGVTVNDTVIHFVNSRLPFGGRGKSGLGRYHGRHGFETFSHKRGVLKKFWHPDIVLRYPPSSPAKNAWVRFFLSGRWKKF